MGKGKSPGFGSSQSGTTQVNIPDWALPFYQGAVNQATALQQAEPLTSFAISSPQMIAGFSPYTAMGVQQTPGLSAVDPAALGAFQSYFTGPEIASQPIPTPWAELMARGQLGFMTGGPLGQSPATQAGMEQWQQQVLPQVEEQAAQMGVGRGGPELEAVAESGSGAFYPLIANEMANRMTSLNVLGNMAAAQTQRGYQPRADVLQALNQQAGGLANLSQTMFDQRVQAIKMQQQAGQIQEDRAQQLFNAAQADFNRQQNLATAASLGPLGSLAQTFGATTTSQRTPGLLASIFGEK